MIPTSIDGTDITGATIDGTDVQEITVDGQTVFSSLSTGQDDQDFFSDDVLLQFNANSLNLGDGDNVSSWTDDKFGVTVTSEGTDATFVSNFNGFPALDSSSNMKYTFDGTNLPSLPTNNAQVSFVGVIYVADVIDNFEFLYGDGSNGYFTDIRGGGTLDYFVMANALAGSNPGSTGAGHASTNNWVTFAARIDIPNNTWSGYANGDSRSDSYLSSYTLGTVDNLTLFSSEAGSPNNIDVYLHDFSIVDGVVTDSEMDAMRAAYGT